jgi:NAD(P)-dependent dehydrogenase (short-subunit alcohol dehydrogenase family)
LADLVAPPAATANATLAAVVSSGASKMTSTPYSPMGNTHHDLGPWALQCWRDVRRVARQVSDRYGHVDILINNASAAFSRRGKARTGSSSPGRPTTSPRSC